MGVFRVLKRSDVSLDECRRKRRQIESRLVPAGYTRRQIQTMLFEWGTLRELEARHTGDNESELGKDD